MFISCHPVLSIEARVALTLRLLGGLTTEEIARGFLVPRAHDRAADHAGQADAGQRRASRSRCRAARGSQARLASVLEVLYLIFNEGYSATAGDDWMRPALCYEALRLGRMLAGLIAGRAGGARPRRADGDPGVAAAGAARSGRPAGPAARPGPRPLGPPADPARLRRAVRAQQLGGRPACTRCRRRSRRATRGLAPRPRRTGGRSRCCTRLSPDRRHLRWWS